MKIIIENFKCPSWNEMQVKHWVLRADDRNALKMLAYNAVRKLFVDPIEAITFTDPVNVMIEAHFKLSNRRDPDNLYVKPIIDGIVKSGLLPDDNGEVIKSLTLSTKIKMPSDQIIILINE